MRFGLDDGSEHTLEEVGQSFAVTRERIRQIEAKALRKLRHPSRSRKLRAFLEGPSRDYLWREFADSKQRLRKRRRRFYFGAGLLPGTRPSRRSIRIVQTSMNRTKPARMYHMREIS